MDTNRPMTIREFQEAEGLQDWRVLGDGACIYFPTASFGESARLVERMSAIAGVDVHPPSIDVREGGVTVRLVTAADDHFGMTERDVEIAQKISSVARELGLSADSSAVQSVLVIPGAPDIADVMPFWRAVLGYRPRPDSPDEDLVDPRRATRPTWPPRPAATRPVSKAPCRGRCTQTAATAAQPAAPSR